jgi:two-component system chemotaxis response regulator CheY
MQTRSKERRWLTVNNILIVDDSRAMRNFLRKALALTSLKIDSVHEATNGAEALDLLELHSIQIIFSDINMPVMDGSVFVAELARREITKSIPVLVVSTDSSTERMEQILALGAKSYIPKPFSPETLEREVIRLMEDIANDEA